MANKIIKCLGCLQPLPHICNCPKCGEDTNYVHHEFYLDEKGVPVRNPCCVKCIGKKNQDNHEA